MTTQITANRARQNTNPYKIALLILEWIVSFKIPFFSLAGRLFKLIEFRNTMPCNRPEAIMAAYLRTENLKNHTLSRGTYLDSPYMGVPPRAFFAIR